MYWHHNLCVTLPIFSGSPSGKDLSNAQQLQMINEDRSKFHASSDPRDHFFTLSISKTSTLPKLDKVCRLGSKWQGLNDLQYLTVRESSSNRCLWLWRTSIDPELFHTSTVPHFHQHTTRIRFNTHLSLYSEQATKQRQHRVILKYWLRSLPANRNTLIAAWCRSNVANVHPQNYAAILTSLRHDTQSTEMSSWLHKYDIQCSLH